MNLLVELEKLELIHKNNCHKQQRFADTAGSES